MPGAAPPPPLGALAVLAVSAVAGVAAFEWVSPIAMLHRELIFGPGLGLLGVAGIFVLDLLVVKVLAF